MGDITMVLMILAFFFGCIGYVTWCGRIIGPDPEEMDAALDSEGGATANAMTEHQTGDAMAVRA